MLEKPRILVSAVVLINNKEEILLAERPVGKALAGYWEFPGGKIEKNEKAEIALKRELKEELDIEVKTEDLSPFTFVAHEYDDIYLIMLVFKCNKWASEITPQENQRIKWVKIEDIKNYKMPAADIPIINRLLEDRKI